MSEDGSKWVGFRCTLLVFTFLIDMWFGDKIDGEEEGKGEGRGG